MFDNSTNTTQCLYLPIINDECVESESEEFTATLYTDDDCISFGTNSTTISIFDDDCECSYYLVTKLWSHFTLMIAMITYLKHRILDTQCYTFRFLSILLQVLQLVYSKKT